MNLLRYIYIYISSLGLSKCIDDELFVRSTRNKFQPHTILFTKYLTFYNN